MKRKIKRLIRKTKKEYLIFAIAAIILLIIIFLILKPEPKNYTFEEGFYKLEKIDQKYNTNFKEEQLNVSMVNFKNIDPLIKEITKFREEIKKASNTKPNQEEAAILLFTEARTLMLLSQKNFILAQAIGNKGLVSDEGFSCSESGYIINTAYYFNLSWSSAVLAQGKLDDLLNHYRDIPYLWNLIGISKAGTSMKKAEFYNSPLAHIKRQININIYALENYCFLNMSQGLSKVNPEDYINLPEKLSKIQKT